MHSVSSIRSVKQPPQASLRIEETRCFNGCPCSVNDDVNLEGRSDESHGPHVCLLLRKRG